MMHCLVTGGGGLLGSHVVEALVRRGETVRVLDDFRRGRLGHLAAVRDRIEVLTGEPTDPVAIRDALEGVTHVFHFPALGPVPSSVFDPRSTHEAGVTGTLNLLLAAREAGVQRIVHGSSASVYGEPGSSPQSEHDVVHPLSPHAIAALTGEQYCTAFTRSYGLETVRLRFFNLFGPRQPLGDPHGAVVPQFIDALLAGKRPIIYGDGRQTRDFTFIDDAVQASLLAADVRRASGRVYNVGTGRPTSLIELVGRLNDLIGSDADPLLAPARPGDVCDSCADIARAQAELGYCPCTDLDTALLACIDYVAAHRRGPKFLRYGNLLGRTTASLESSRVTGLVAD